MFRTSNPALGRNPVYGQAQSWEDLESQGRAEPAPRAASEPKQMTLQGTVNKTFFLLALCVTTALLGFNGITSGAAWAMPAMWGGAIGGFVLVLVSVFRPQFSPVTAPLYSLSEGFFVGGISGWYAQAFAEESGLLNTALIFNAVLLTFGIAGGLLTAYSMRLIRPGRTFYSATIAATFGLVIYGLVAMVAGLAGADSLWSVYDPNNGGLVSIGFSLFVVLIASANLVLDFDLINNGVKARAPRYMEWYSGMALMITLVWLYIEVLRLLAKLQSRE